jgi:hypothetical protein
VLTVAGLLVMGGAGARASRYLPGWGESEPRCVRDGTCTPGEAGSALDSIWWVGSSIGLVVLLAVALMLWSLPTTRRPPSWRSLPSVQHAAVTGVLGGVALAVVGLPVLLSMFLSWHAVPSAVLGAWLVQSAVVVGVDRTVGSPATSLRGASFTALALTPMAAVGTVASYLVGQDLVAAVLSVPLVYGAALGVGVLGARKLAEAGPPPASAWTPPPSGTEHRPSSAATMVVAVLSVLSVLAVAQGVRALTQPAWPGLPRLSAPSPTIEPSPLPVPPPAPITTAAPPAPVEASRACATTDLTFAVVGFDAAMGARAAFLQATNAADGPCWVEGTPVVVLMQGGRPLALSVHPGRTPDGEPAMVQRVGLAPGGTALALLSWRSYGGWADSESPQSVTAALDATSTLVPVETDPEVGAAPFDIADGGAWAIAPWAPLRN